ncbi:MAG TPA: GAF domain-containing protein [Stellaceae bacterium]|nr:GAF domain-containing protein [Stellaceae bacterium]
MNDRLNDRQVPASPAALERVRKYHRLVLAFSKDALGTLELPALLRLACACASEGTAVQRAKVLQYRAENDDLLLVAGIGWNPDLIGRATLSADTRSPPGLSVRAGEPTFIDDLPEDPAFDYSDLLRSYGIVSLVNVPIEVEAAVWGVLEVDSEQRRRFDADDREFLCGLAEIIGRTIENRRQLERAEQTGLDKRIELEERETLFCELQHRIGNQLQLIIGALEIATTRTADPDARNAFQDVIRRTVAIARSHDQLSLTRLEREASLSTYLNRLIPSLAVPDSVKVVSAIEDATTPIGTAVRLGLIINELVTNSVKHAFGEAGGHITISVGIEADRGAAVLRVGDDGRGMRAAPRGGSGIGLIETLSRQIGGTVEWATGAGEGTRFTLRFPLDHA